MGIKFIRKTRVFTDLDTRIRGHYLLLTKQDLDKLEVKVGDSISIGVDEDEPSINILFLVKEEDSQYKISENKLSTSAPYRVNVKPLLKELLNKFSVEKDYKTKQFSFAIEDEESIRGIKLVAKDIEEIEQGEE